MKYGLLYYKETDNIGDDIQTYVAKRFLPHIDYYVDREDLNCFIPKKKEYVSIIMNGWFLHNKLAWPPSPYINPLLISMHFTSLDSIDVGEKYLEGIGGQYLKKYQEIGCRDYETQKRLNEKDIKTYFSGCMTLTLNKFANIEKKDYIVVADVSNSVMQKIKENTKREIKEITHSCEPSVIKNKTIEERMNDVEELLKTYQAAHVVITSRLHVALPSIALGTPVIMVLKDDYEKDRLETFVKYVGNSFCETEFKKINGNDIEEYINNPNPNNSEYEKIKLDLIEKCENFIEKCEHTSLNEEYLPDVENYYNSYVSKISWYKYLHEDLRKKAKDNLYAFEKEKNELINSLKGEFNTEKDKISNELKKIELEKNNIYKDLEISSKQLILEKQKVEDLMHENKILKLDKEEMEKTLINIYNSRSWKLLEKYRKIKYKLKKNGKVN